MPRPVACTASARRWSTPLSGRLDVEVDRGGKTYGMSFRRGEPGVYDDSAEGEVPGPEAPFAPYVKGSERVVGKAKRGVTGSRVRFWPDHQIFEKGSELDYAQLADRARQTSFLIPGLRIVVRPSACRARRGAGPERGGLPPRRHHRFVEYLAPDAPVTDVWRLQGSGSFRETVPILDATGRMTPTELEREYTVDIALRWGTDYDTRMQSFVNIITTPRAAPTSPASSSPCSRSSASSSSSTPAGSRSAATRSRRTTCSPA